MFDIIIVGSGPAGLTAAIYAKRANLNIAVIEKEYLGTGQIAESERVDNYPGLIGTSGFDLGDKFRNHAEELGTEFIEGNVTSIKKNGDGDEAYFTLLCEDGSSHESKTIIYAAGAFPRKAGIAGEERLLGRGVSFCALCDGAFYRGKKVAVLGGGDTALDDALYLSGLCEQVYLIHRRNEFRGASSTVSLLRQKENVSFILCDEATEILGEKKVEGIVLRSGKQLAVDGVFIAFGSVPNSKLVNELVETDSAGYIVAGENTESSCPGLYAAGDVRTKELRQVVTAVADGANAVTSAQKILIR